MSTNKQVSKFLMNRLIQQNSCIPLTGIVLAGGASKRLGTDKTALPGFGTKGTGADLLARTVALLQGLTSKVLVQGRQDTRFECLPDTEAGCGPVGGITTALRHIQGPCLVLSADLPFMDAATLHKLVSARKQRPENTLLTTYHHPESGNVEHLIGIYEYECLPWMSNTLDKKLLKIAKVLPPEQIYLLPYLMEESLPFFNINYPADLLLAQKYQELARGSNN